MIKIEKFTGSRGLKRLEINLDKRRRIKDEWNEIFYEILKPFLISKKVIPIEESAGVLFILKK